MGGGFAVQEDFDDMGLNTGSLDAGPRDLGDTSDQGEDIDPVDAAPDLDLALDTGEPDLGFQDMPEDQDLGAPLDMSAERDMPSAIDAGGGADLGSGVFPPVTDDPLTGNGRPARVFVPTGFDNSREVPLIVALHGYGGNSSNIPRYFSLEANVDARDFIMIAPDGTADLFGTQFWNATDACCDGFSSGVDDHAYLRGLIEEASARFSIDQGRVYVVGHSNGGFMSYRMACDSADYVTGIFSLAGATYTDAMACTPSEPVAIFQLHGTNDPTIKYNGGSAYPTAPQHPGAVQTVTTWAGYNGCATTPTMLDATSVNAVTVEEATVLGFSSCPANAPVELWTLTNGGHNPGIPQTFAPMLLDRLFAIDRTP